MLSNLNPSDPPNDISTEAVDESQDNGVTLEPNAHLHPHLVERPSIAEHMNNSMGSDGQDERSDTYDDQDEDEDDDMSDEGAPLTMTLSHAEQLNAELDMLDAELMGADNLNDMLMDNDYYHQEDAYDEDFMEEEMGPVPVPNLPVAMSAVSLQLQHIQDGQGHADVEVVQDTQHAPVHDNSTLPFHFHNPVLNPVPPGAYPWDSSLSSAGLASLHQAYTLALANAPHLSGTAGGTPPPATDVQGQSEDSDMPSLVAGGVEDDQVTEADEDPVDDQFNLSLAEFLYNWAHTALRDEGKKRPRGPSIPAIESQREMKNTGPMTRDDLLGERCDIQRINWADLGVSRLEARQARRHTYKNYTNLRFQPPPHPRLNGARLMDNEDYFRFRKMDFDQAVHLSHFQLRNLVSCASRDHIYYAGRSVVHHYNPTRAAGPSSVAMDLTNPTVLPTHIFSGGGVQISTLTVAHDILIAGGFSGEYGMINLRAPKETKHTEGIITHNINGITNHVQVHLSRTSSSPLVTFASNDMSVRVLDINTNKFIAEHRYEQAINCTALSPDQRLRVMVGDNRNIQICNAETGEVLQDLEGHRDYGFACDWADDGWTVATGNQDLQVKIWDARKWKMRDGRACPVATVAAEMAGVRKLKFSPLGSGKRVLVAAEPADFVNVIDAEMFTSKQTLSFFGEIGGVDFTNDGQDLIVANCDNMRGGIMEFERCNLAAEALHDLEAEDDYTLGRHRINRDRYYDWKSSDAEIVQDARSRGTQMHRSRRAAMLGTDMGIF